MCINREKLWVKIIRGKYRCGGSVWPHICRNILGSNAWRGICLVWEDFSKKISWHIGDGKDARFWLDQWVPNTGMLIKKDTMPLHESDLTKLVGEVVDDLGAGTSKIRLSYDSKASFSCFGGFSRLPSLGQFQGW